MDRSPRQIRFSPFIAGLRLTLFVLALVSILFVISGDTSWIMAWVLTGLLFGTVCFNVFFLMRKSPDLIEERMHPKEGAKAWDIYFSALVGTLGPLSTFFVAGLDHRFSWTPELSPAISVVAVLVVVSGHALTSWSMSVNKFFSAIVRIQHDRGHVVVSSGPYRIVRHPGYAGAILTYVAAPIMLGSCWALIPAVATILLVLVRTTLEDNTLLRELEGYQEYVANVRYRLIPGVW